ncbi:membrane protein [Palaeococcus ferrophilus]|uniref:membrane protein n=1 Tax=Palaeococcus ferrophilus TaxID=83868 RepID=UPI00064FE313|nr:membrane protein [Palaeococcus ferrophilus]
MEEVGFKCERCGAPLEVSPETIIAICPYCGFPNHISGSMETEKVYIVPTLDKNAVAKAFWDRVERDFDLRRMKEKLDIVDIEGHYAPYWVGTVHVEGIVEYTVREEECHTDSKGNTHCHTVERHYRDRVNENLDLIGSARRQVKSLGVEDLIRHYSKTKPRGKKLLELDEDEWGRIKLEILNTEMDEAQAKSIMHEDAIDVIRDRYSSKADRIDRFDVRADEPQNAHLVLLPMWTVYYKFENSIFHVVFAGWDGKDVMATEPMAAWRRAQYLAGTLLGILVGGAGVAYTAGSGWVLPAFSILIGTGISAYFGRLVLEGQRIERSGTFFGMRG